MSEECLATPVIIASLYEEPLRVDTYFLRFKADAESASKATVCRH
jgi:hypothetical protein